MKTGAQWDQNQAVGTRWSIAPTHGQWFNQRSLKLLQQGQRTLPSAREYINGAIPNFGYNIQLSSTRAPKAIHEAACEDVTLKSRIDASDEPPHGEKKIDFFPGASNDSVSHE